MKQVKYEGIYSLCFYCGLLGHKQESCCYHIKEMERNDSEAERSPNQGSEEEKQSNPNYGPWMLVTRKKNLVRNGQTRFPLGSDLERDVSPKGIFVQKGVNREDLRDDGLVKPNKVDLLSNQPNSARANF